MKRRQIIKKDNYFKHVIKMQAILINLVIFVVDDLYLYKIHEAFHGLYTISVLHTPDSVVKQEKLF